MENISKNLYSNDFLDFLEDIAFIKDMTGRYIACNELFCEFIKLKKSDIIGQTDYTLFNKEIAQTCSDNDEKIISSGHKDTFTETFKTPNDDTIYFETTKNIIKDENGKSVGIFGIAKNITAQKEYETLYNINQKILEKTIEDLPLEDILTLIVQEAENINKNMICSILLVNKNKTRFTHCIAPSLPKYYNDAVKEVEIINGAGSCGTAVATSSRVIVENINTHPYWEEYTPLTNEIGVHACWSQPFYSKQNDVAGTFAIYYKKPKYPSNFEIELIDSFAHLVSLAVNKRARIDKIKEQEGLLIHQSKMATLGEMLENIAHQWRQPLSVISTVSSGIKIDKDFYIENKQDFDRSLDKIITTTNYLSDTINDFRTYFVKNKEKEHFNIQNSVNKALNIIDAKFNELNIKYIINIENINMYSYENELIHVLLNVLNNAKDALEVNNIDNKLIFIDIKNKNNTCIIKIKDNALGIKENILDRIFEPYFTTKHKNQGTGIGLYMVENILKKHMNGDIRAKNCSYFYKNSKYNGAQFTIIIPLNKF